jgi:penicillin-binding protein 1A
MDDDKKLDDKYSEMYRKVFDEDDIDNPLNNKESDNQSANPNISKGSRLDRLRTSKGSKQIKAEKIKMPEVPLFVQKFVNREKIKTVHNKIIDHFTIENEVEDGMVVTRSTKGKNKSKSGRVNTKKIIQYLTIGLIILLVAFIIIVTGIIKTTPPIEPDNIYSLLTENSVLFDDRGNMIEGIQGTGGMRTNVAYNDMPPFLIEAFVSIEDKTFWEHNGFNFVRLFGAVFEGVFTGDNISGTSTITQQLARNLYLAETKSKRSITRKIREAYYTVELENHLSKEQIIEAYLNTIYLGANANGVQAASQAYFSKDVKDLSLAECTILACIPKSPTKYSPLKKLETDEVAIDDPNIISKGDAYTIVYDPAFKDRQILVVRFMYENNYITQEERDLVLSSYMKDLMVPSFEATDELSSYFVDYIVNEVTVGLMDAFGVDKTEAKNMIYNSGLNIYSTMNLNAQRAIETEFDNPDNFPGVVNLNKDSFGNIIDSTGKVLLFNYDNYFNSNGDFILRPDEFIKLDNADLMIFDQKRLNIYKTKVAGNVDYSIEFKSIYQNVDHLFYSYAGGVILIPAEFKEVNSDGNIIINNKFFKEHPEYMNFNDDGTITISSGYYTLKPRVRQPQAACVITDYKTGQIKAMAGGRNLDGDLLFNRATSTQPPGSSIKPIGVYGPAIELGLTQLKPWNAAYVLDDSPNYYNDELWPKNWYDSYRGLATVREAIQQSMNVPAVKMFGEVGATASTDFIKKVGVTSVVETGNVNDQNAAALALGGMTDGISPLEMASAYGTFPNQGVYVKPVSYTKVTNKKGEVILESNSQKTKAMDPGTAFIMTDILQSVVTQGIAGAAAIGTSPVGGKTGTTTNNYDAWFVGFTPYYSASVWIGNDIDIELSKGSIAASRLWSKIMKRVHYGKEAGVFPVATNVVSIPIDTKSGKIPSDLSALDPRGTIRNEYFIEGTQPTEIDTTHVVGNVCSESGYLATPYCPSPIGKVFVKRPYPVDPLVGDLQYELPSYYCNLHNQDTINYPIDPTKVLDPNSGYFPPIVDPNNPVDPTLPIDPNAPNPDEPPGWL